MAENNQQLVSIDEQVIKRVNQLCEVGLVMPKDYNYVNAIKASYIKLQETTDKAGNSALAVCTPISIVNALFQMVTYGLDMSKNQCYPIVRGKKLCLHVSYFGKIRMVRRVFPKWEPHAQVIRKGDVFKYEINPETGKIKVIEHTQKLENRDNPEFLGGYIYLPTESGELDCYLMTKKQIMTAWSKSSSKEHLVHKEFDEKMIGKTLVNSGCNIIINAYPDLFVYGDGEEDEEIEGDTKEVKEPMAVFQEAVEVEEVKEEPKVLEQPAEQVEANPIEVAEQVKDDDDF